MADGAPPPGGPVPVAAAVDGSPASKAAACAACALAAASRPPAAVALLVVRLRAGDAAGPGDKDELAGAADALGAALVAAGLVAAERLRCVALPGGAPPDGGAAPPPPLRVALPLLRWCERHGVAHLFVGTRGCGALRRALVSVARGGGPSVSLCLLKHAPTALAVTVVPAGSGAARAAAAAPPAAPPARRQPWWCDDGGGAPPPPPRPEAQAAAMALGVGAEGALALVGSAC